MKYKVAIEIIFKLALEINSKTDNEVFITLSPHVNQVSITVYLGGWDTWSKTEKERGTIKADKLLKRINIYYDSTLRTKPQTVKNFITYLRLLK